MHGSKPCSSTKGSALSATALLEDVLDVLDGLRDGGRAVGVISHVAEMRQRIPTQLHVAKGRTGSRIVQT